MIWFGVATFLFGFILGLSAGFASVWRLYVTTSVHLDEALRLLSDRQERELEPDLLVPEDRPTLRLLPKPEDS